MNSENQRPTIAAIVMTANERVNIGKCLASLSKIDQIFLLDSNSNDGTIEVAQAFPNVTIVPTNWLGYAATFNSGITLAQGYDWILRIDADEELIGDVRKLVSLVDRKVAGVVITRRICFQERPLRFGPHSRLKMLRLFRTGRGSCELSSADEHIIVDGPSVFAKDIEIWDRDKKPFSLWLTKHIRWAKKEASNVLHGTGRSIPDNLDVYNRGKRFAKVSIYYRLPPYLRAGLYFLYRFFVCLECLGGRDGISWCVLQGLWYRVLVDFYLLYPHLIDEEK
jgi:glycosyltransferase involved in cell wall biosynthesis